MRQQSLARSRSARSVGPRSWECSIAAWIPTTHLKPLLEMRSTVLLDREFAGSHPVNPTRNEQVESLAPPTFFVIHTIELLDGLDDVDVFEVARTLLTELMVR